MQTQLFNEAKSLMDKIDICNRDLDTIIQQQVNVERKQGTRQIRFGGNFNVTHPIELKEETFAKIVELIRVEKANLLGELDDQFDAL